MSLDLLTDPAAVNAAMDEYDALTRDVFLEKYGFGRAFTYFVTRNGKSYDSKAIVAVAVGKQHPDRGPLTHPDFSGGVPVAEKLRSLGFTVVDGPETADFGSEAALGFIRGRWGHEIAAGKYIAVWHTPAGRQLALQLDQLSARIWVEVQPPLEGLKLTPYGPDETRHSYLRANAPKLAVPNPAWLVTISSETQLNDLLDWYGAADGDSLNLTELQRLKAVFLREMGGFQTFESPGRTYQQNERAYKDELVELFAETITPLVSAGPPDEASAGALATAYYELLTRKLSSSNGPQNLVSWQAVDRLKPTETAPAAPIGRALHRLLGTSATAAERLEVFISEAGEVFRERGASGPLGIARLLGSCALMLQSPRDFVVIRTDVFERAVVGLRGRKFPTYNDEPARVRESLALSEEVFEQLSSWGWAPRDLIDVQGFLWVSQMYDTQAVTGTFASLVQEALARFAQVREGPLKTVPDLWATMDGIKTVLASLPAVKAQGALKIEWSLGKGVWAGVPWIAIMDPEVTTTTQEGVYIVFLISRDMSVVHLTLAQGTTALVNEHKQSGALPILRERSEFFRSQMPELASFGYRLDGDLALGAEGWRASSYEASCIAHIPLSVEALPTDEDLNTLLEPLLSAYGRITASDALAVLREPPSLPVEAQYTVDEAMRGLFLDRAEFERILSIWRDKKNLVLQGAPGVGKSFIAKRLAYALMEQKDPTRVEVVQFHQSYGYEDFVQGYRPTKDGGFELRDGVFFRFCERARSDPGRPYVFIIDEINRGNLSKVFGELMLLIEHDKRSADWAARLAYADADTPAFYVPANVSLLGMMNTADRSLSLVDYALRRRFAFVPLRPGFAAPGFSSFLQSRGVAQRTIRAVIDGMGELNDAIAEDHVNLGPGFQIGHSFFTPAESHVIGQGWFERVVDTEIRPLLEEYWFDAPERARDWCDKLLSRA